MFPFHVLDLICCSLGALVHPWWYTLLLVTLGSYFGGVHRVVRTVVLETPRLMSVVAAVLLVFLVFSALSMVLFPDAYDFPDLHSRCYTLWTCFLTHVDYSFRAAPYWGDRAAMLPETAPWTALVGLAFFIIVVQVFSAMVRPVHACVSVSVTCESADDERLYMRSPVAWRAAGTLGRRTVTYATPHR